MELHRLQKLAGLPLTEAKSKEVKLDAVEKSKYDSSTDFEDAFSNVTIASKHIVEVLGSAAFKDWMKASKDNYNFNMAEYGEVLGSAEYLQKGLNKLYKTLVSLD